MIKPAVQREVTIDLPSILVESLGVGADLLAQYLTTLAEVGGNEPEHHAPPLPVLCRICERHITPWWFPKHTDLCVPEHKAEAELQMTQENLTEHRNSIVRVLDSLESHARQRSVPPTETVSGSSCQAEYKGLPIGPNSSSSSGTSSEAISRSPSISNSMSSSRDRGGRPAHRRARSFTVRRPLARIVELVLDLCDTALEINTPALKEPRNQESDEPRTQSPQSEGRISQVLQWQSPSAGALENEEGLSKLCDDTTNFAKAKIDAVLSYRKILEYSERIRNECTDLVQECMDAALEKASRITAGEISSSGESSDESTSRGEQTDDEVARKAMEQQQLSGGRLDGPSAMSAALHGPQSSSTSPHSSPQRVNSPLSHQPSSPRAGPTPRSHATGINAVNNEFRSLTLSEADAGADSDTSTRSSIRSRPARTDSPASEMSASRFTHSRERKRKSLVLPRAVSASRATSPARIVAPMVSPLKIPKPRGGPESAKSPLMSPTLSNTLSNELASHTLPVQTTIHHRRQSSAASSVALSPRLSMSHHPQPRAVAPSIKDFEIIKPISKGAFGSVYLTKKKSTGDYYAIKALKKTDMIAKNQVANVKAERAILMWQGESEFVAKLYWTFPSKDYIFLVMEYLNGGDCASLIKALGTLPETWAKRYLAEVVLGVEHLHNREIVHRDLKPDNLLIDQKGHLKLTDFGLSRMGLIGRQKRALSGKADQHAPDPLKQGPFARSMSMASSRSASFDTQGNISPANTPNLTPVFTSEIGQPSYFSLSREASGNFGDRSRQGSGHQSDISDADLLTGSFRRFSIYDDPWISSRESPKSDEPLREDHSESLHLSKLSSGGSNTTNSKNQTPPSASTMLPPPMALFDPDDSNRRFVGTPDYLAPETINGVGQDEMSDWWSLGCIIFEFVFGYPPFHADTPEQVFENILARRIDWPTDDDTEISEDCKDFMTRLMCIDPTKRLGSNAGDKYSNGGEEIRSHPWLADVDWDRLNETEASFIPAPENPEDTEYFDSRGAAPEDFTTEFDDQASSPNLTPGAEYPDRPHDALSRVRSQVNSMKRGLMPLHIPPHVRDGRSRRLSEPVGADDFGQFSFKNLPVLEKANKDVIQKLRAEAMQAQSKSAMQQSKSPTVTSPQLPPPLLEGSPTLSNSLKRTLSTNRGQDRSTSPSSMNYATSSPSRVSQPSSPLVQFSAGQYHERRKTSSGSSQSGTSLQPGNFFDVPRIPSVIKRSSQDSQGSSPVRTNKPALPTEKDISQMPSSNVVESSPRSRSHTVGSNESEAGKESISHHQKQRSQVLDISPSSSDNDDSRQKAALLRVQRRRQSSRRLSQISLMDGPMFRPLDILICEDHPVSRLVMEKLLEKLRCRTIVVQNGAEAMRYAMSSVKFDAIMMEFKLPQVNGADVARMIRETKNANNHTPIIAVTGYLKELQAPHHFDALVEKPASNTKLIEVLSRLCQWKAPPIGWTASRAPPTLPPIPQSSLRNESVHADDSPHSVSSSFQAMAGSSYHGSSRDDSMSSISAFTDAETRTDDLRLPEYNPASRQSEGLDIIEAHARRLDSRMEDSAPAALAPHDLHVRKQPSAEKMQAKRLAAAKETPDGGEFGDDEDELLGARSGSRSPRGKGHLREPSKLSSEMLRTESQNSVISVLESVAPSLALSPPTEAQDVAMHSSATTPPEIFPLRPGGEIRVFDMDATPRPGSSERFELDMITEGKAS